MNASSPAGTSQPASPYLDRPSPTAIVLPLLAITTLIVDAPCFVWHVCNRNLAASLLVGWTMLQNLLVFVNAAIWPTDDIDAFWHGRGYCDVAVKLDWMGGAAVTAATTCIMRALAAALDTRRTCLPGGTGRRRDRLKSGLLTYGLCLAFPVYMAVAAWLVQPQRYYVYAISGCVMVEWHSAATVLLCYLPPLLLMAATCYYAALTLLRLRRYKRDIASVLASTDSGLSRNRFMRLLGLALVLLLVYTPLFVAILVQQEAVDMYPFDWRRIHDPATFDAVVLVRTYGHARVDRWVRVSVGFVIFACFGFGKDIKATYRKCLQRTGLAFLIPLLHLDEEGSRSRRQGRASNGHLHLSPLSSSHGSDRSLKSHAKRVMSKLSFMTRSSSSTASDTQTGSLGSTIEKEKAVVPDTHAEKASTSVMHPAAGPDGHTAAQPTQHLRPRGILERDLVELDRSAPACVLPPGARDSIITALPPASVRDHFVQSTPPTADREDASIPPDPRPKPRSRFWQRLGAYVHTMGPRPANNLGVVRGHSPERYVTGTRRAVGAGNDNDNDTKPDGGDTAQVSHFAQMLDREYERYVVDRLA